MDDKALLEQLADCERERQRQSLAAPHYHPIPGGLLECKCGDELTRQPDVEAGRRRELEIEVELLWAALREISLLEDDPLRASKTRAIIARVALRGKWEK